MIEWVPFSEKSLDVLQHSTARLVILHGAVRSAKTITCNIRWLTYIANGPQGDLVMLGKTRDTLQRNVLNTLFDIVGDANWKWVNKQAGELLLLGRRIYCVGAANEEAESKIRGATFAGALCDEVSLYPESVFTQLMARLSIRGAQCFCNTNPDNPGHWFYKNFMCNAKITDKQIWKFYMEDNLSLDPQYIMNLKAEYSGVWYERMILGNWVAAQGRVYDKFTREQHVIDTRAYIANQNFNPNSIRWVVGCDYGTSTVMTWGLYAVLPNRVTLKVKEYYYDAVKRKAQRTDSEFIGEFQNWLGGIVPWAVYVDPSAASWKLELRRKNYRVFNANNDVINGIRIVASKLQTGKYFIDQTCAETFREYNLYEWDSNAQQSGLDKPVKEHDHSCVIGDTLVWTTKGKQRIVDLVGTEGECYCYDFNTQQFVVREFFNVHQTKAAAEVFEVELEDGRTIRLTADHKLRTAEGWKPVSELTTTALDAVATSSSGINLGYTRIQNIKSVGVEAVYNMTVDDPNHNYLANDGILSKNCDCDRYVLATMAANEYAGVYNIGGK